MAAMTTAHMVNVAQLPEVAAVVRTSLAYFAAAELGELPERADRPTLADLFVEWMAATAALRAAWGEGDKG